MLWNKTHNRIPDRLRKDPEMMLGCPKSMGQCGDVGCWSKPQPLVADSQDQDTDPQYCMRGESLRDFRWDAARAMSTATRGAKNHMNPSTTGFDLTSTIESDNEGVPGCIVETDGYAPVKTCRPCP